MAEKEKQARFNKLHINQLYRRLEPLEAAVAAAAAAAQEPPPPPPPEQQAPPQPEPEERVMLCLVHLQPSAAEVEAGAARLVAQQEAQRAAERRRQAAAAVSIQAAARGFLARRRLAVQHAAATTIQAAARGYLVRRSLATVWEDEGEQEPRGQPAPAEPELPASERLLLRQRAAERQYRERAAAAKSKPQKRLPSAAPGSRGANTAPEAAARKRSMMASATPDAAGGRAAVDSRARPGNGALDSRRASSLLSPAGPAGGSRDGAAPTGAGAAGRRLSSVRDSGAAGSSGPAGQPSTSPSRRRQSNAHCLEEAGASPRTSSGSGSGHAARRASVRSNSMASSEGTTGPVWLPDGTCVPRLQLYDHEGRLESKPARVSLGFGSGAPRKAGRL